MVSAAFRIKAFYKTPIYWLLSDAERHVCIPVFYFLPCSSDMK